jgi:hypothetical protein
MTCSGFKCIKLVYMKVGTGSSERQSREISRGRSYLVPINWCLCGASFIGDEEGGK